MPGVRPSLSLTRSLTRSPSLSLARLSRVYRSCETAPHRPSAFPCYAWNSRSLCASNLCFHAVRVHDCQTMDILISGERLLMVKASRAASWIYIYIYVYVYVYIYIYIYIRNWRVYAQRRFELAATRISSKHLHVG